MPPIKSLDMISAKWARVSQGAGESYAEGVRNPRTPWKAATQAANGNYKQAMQASLSEDRFAKGVSKSSDATWQEGAISKGVQRWPAGIALSTDNYAKGFEPYRQVINSTNLPARGPKGSPGNITRVAILAKALNDKKKQLLGQAG